MLSVWDDQTNGMANKRHVEKIRGRQLFGTTYRITLLEVEP